MKQYLKVALVLMLITSICAVLIALLNTVTAPIIEKNAYDKEQKTLSVMYDNAVFEETEYNEDSKGIEKKFIAKDKDTSNVLGYVYIVSGKNAYGMIRLMVRVENEKATKVEVMDNTESFKKKVNDFINGNVKTNDLTINDLYALDVKCGATYGAKLVQELLNVVIKEGGANND